MIMSPWVFDKLNPQSTQWCIHSLNNTNVLNRHILPWDENFLNNPFVLRLDNTYIVYRLSCLLYLLKRISYLSLLKPNYKSCYLKSIWICSSCLQTGKNVWFIFLSLWWQEILITEVFECCSSLTNFRHSRWILTTVCKWQYFYNLFYKAYSSALYCV
jgi:hypothetical protein